MIKPVINLLVALILFGAPQACMGDYADEFPEMQNEEQLNAQEIEKENQEPHSCPNCNRKPRKKDRFLERQYQETGWPGRRDELSDQLSR